MSSRGISQERALSQDRETPFAGYGDRVGSGVLMAPAKWKGGELVTDPVLVTKSLKPRRMFYSPIGDGVVSADGVELKKLPPDLTPKVEVINQRVVERGDAGKAGIRIKEKTWTTGGGGEFAANEYGNQYGPDGGRSSAGPALNMAAPKAPAPISPSSGTIDLSPPSKNNFDNLSNLVPTPTPLPKPDLTKNQIRRDSGGVDQRPAAAAAPPSAPSPLQAKSPTNGYPGSGRTSAASALYEPGYRYEIKRDYQVTNPKELIHQYATGTPITVIDPTIETTTRTITKQRFSQTIEEFGPFPPYTAGSSTPSPLKFARELRDQTLTDSQRRANQNSQPANTKDTQYEQRIRDISRSTSRTGPPSEIDQLTDRLASGLGSPRY